MRKVLSGPSGYLSVSDDRKLSYNDHINTENQFLLVGGNQERLSERLTSTLPRIFPISRENFAINCIYAFLNECNSQKKHISPLSCQGKINYLYVEKTLRHVRRRLYNLFIKAKKKEKFVMLESMCKNQTTIPFTLLRDCFMEEFDSRKWHSSHSGHRGNRLSLITLSNTDILIYPSVQFLNKVLFFAYEGEKLVKLSEIQLKLPVLEHCFWYKNTEQCVLVLRCMYCHYIFNILFTTELKIDELNHYKHDQLTNFGLFSNIFAEYSMCCSDSLSLYTVEGQLLRSQGLSLPNDSLRFWRRGATTDHPRELMLISELGISITDFRTPSSRDSIFSGLNDGNDPFCPVIKPLPQFSPYHFLFCSTAHVNLIDRRNLDSLYVQFKHHLNHEPCYFSAFNTQFNHESVDTFYISSLKNSDCVWGWLKNGSDASLQANIPLPSSRQSCYCFEEVLGVHVLDSPSLSVFELGSDGAVYKTKYRPKKPFSTNFTLSSVLPVDLVEDNSSIIPDHSIGGYNKRLYLHLQKLLTDTSYSEFLEKIETFYFDRKRKSKYVSRRPCYNLELKHEVCKLNQSWLDDGPVLNRNFLNFDPKP